MKKLKLRRILIFLFIFTLKIESNAQPNSINLYCKAVLLEASKPDSSILLLDSAFKLNNTGLYVLERKANILLSINKIDQAIDVFKYISNFNQHIAKYGLARCYAAQHKANESLIELDFYFKTGIPLFENKIRFDQYFRNIDQTQAWIDYWKLEHYTSDQQLAKDCIFMYNSGQADEALSLLNTRIRKSKAPELFYARGFIYKEMNLFQPSVDDYRKAVKSDSRNVKWLSEYATALYHSSKYEECIKVIHQVLTIEPALFNMYLLRANALENIEKFEDALADIEFYLVYFPNDALVWKRKAEIQTAYKLLLPALVSINKAIMLKPEHCDWRFYRAILYLKTEVLQRALLDFNDVIACQPQNAEAWFKRGELYYKMGKKEAACSNWKQAAKLGYLEAFKRTEHVCTTQ